MSPGPADAGRSAGPHEAHPDATLSLTEVRPDGSRVHQSWTICACDLPHLRSMLGDPHQESIATLEATQAIGRAVLAQPGSVQAQVLP